MSDEFKNLYGSMLVKDAKSIQNAYIKEYIIENKITQRIFSDELPIDVQDDFLDFYPRWIASSKLNNFSGLSAFPHRYISIGTTQSIDDFHFWCKKTNRTVKVFRGEYPYSRNISVKEGDKFIDDSKLKCGDAVIISLPFSATGDIHPQWNELMDTCDRLKIPVMVDAAFFGTCYDITVDLSRDCIDTVAFSPTKGLNCGKWRSGICFTKRSSLHCPLGIQTEWHHGVHLNTAICYHLMQAFSPDTVPLKWKDAQHRACAHYGLTPSKTVHLTIGDERWKYFARDDLYNRVNIYSAIKLFS